MGDHGIFFAAYELGLGVVFGLLSAFVTLRVLRWTRQEADAPILSGNLAVGAIYGTSVVCVGLLVHAGAVPSVDAMRAMVLSQRALTLSMVAISLGYFLAFYAISLVLSLAIIWMALRVYMASTPNIDEVAELERGNGAVALVLCGIIIALALAVRPPLERFVHALVDFESLDAFAPAEPEERDTDLIIPEPAPMPR